jgi:regulator of nucleoside diphosphate kinase
MTKQVWTTYTDRERLLAYLSLAEDLPDAREQPYIAALEQELSDAHVYVDSDEVPPNLITMRSRVLLKNLTTGDLLHCALVYPGESDPDRLSISVLAPLGTGMLGHRVGDTFDVDLPRGTERYQVERITYQPEAAGDYDL